MNKAKSKQPLLKKMKTADEVIFNHVKVLQSVADSNLFKVDDAKFKRLDSSTIADYLKGVQHVATELGGDSADWKVFEIGDGNLNFVFLVQGPKKSVILKQVLMQSPFPFVLK